MTQLVQIVNRRYSFVLSREKFVISLLQKYPQLSSEVCIIIIEFCVTNQVFINIILDY